MSGEVVQWLSEIRALQDELTQCKSDRDASEQSAAHWRELYSTEAQQRRVEARLAREDLKRIELEIRQLKAESATPAVSEDRAAVEAEVMAVREVAVLQQQLIVALEERDRALAALTVEQEQHQLTRDSLTAIISDTVEQLAREHQ